MAGHEPSDVVVRVTRRAEIHVRSTGRHEVRRENVAISLSSERDSPAVRLLEGQGMARIDAVNLVVHGVRERRPRDGEGGGA